MAPPLVWDAVFEATPLFWSVVRDMPGIRDAVTPDSGLGKALWEWEGGALRSGPHQAAPLDGVAVYPRRRSSPMAADEAPETTDTVETDEDTTAHAGNEAGDGEADAE